MEELKMMIEVAISDQTKQIVEAKRDIYRSVADTETNMDYTLVNVQELAFLEGQKSALEAMLELVSKQIKK